MRIVVAVNNRFAGELLQHSLQIAGYRPLITDNGHEVLRLVETANVQVVICDRDLPKTSGLELCQRIRESDQARYVFVMLLSAQCNRLDQVTGLAAGADAVLPQSITAAALLSQLQTAERMLSLEIHEAALFAMAKLAESRDADTGEHLDRVRRYTRVLAQSLVHLPEFRQQIDGDFIRLVTLTSPLHDIGKVAVPDQVLLKPGRLTAEEFNIIKTHTSIGAQTLDLALQRFPEARFLRMARDIAISHHERWDGSGYPYGLQREDIPLCGRLVSVADVYDALTSKRVYKDAWSHEAACQMIEDGVETQFDPRVVKAFRRVAPRFREIRRRYDQEESLMPCLSGGPTPTGVLLSSPRSVA
jgi:putative two-component system response regulator